MELEFLLVCKPYSTSIVVLLILLASVNVYLVQISICNKLIKLLIPLKAKLIT